MGDRLEPSAGLADVGAFEIAPLPLSVVFWRPSAETSAKHRNPLFVEHLGTGPRDLITVDILHALFLGPMNLFVKIALWNILESGVYGSMGDQQERLANSILALRNALMNFYKRHDRENKGATLTRCSDLTPKMLGTPADQKCKTKGAETWGILLFVISELK